MITAIVLASLLSVVRVVDGDTVKLEFIGTVRLIGIDTPETVHPRRPIECFGPEASAFLKGLLYEREVSVELKGFDRYKRSLGYLEVDGLSVNALMIGLGYAKAYRLFQHQYMEEFIRLEAEAKAANRGLWKACKVVESEEVE